MSSPGLVYGQVLTAAQWNAYLQTVSVDFGQILTAAQWNVILSGLPAPSSVPASSEVTVSLSGTGPPYPRYAPGQAPGENAIGSFIIGESPIGTIPPFDLWRTIISQYANSPRLYTLITNFFQYIDQTANFDLFFDDIWNIDTAQGYGLDVWGRILGVNRVMQVVPSSTYLGFAGSGDANYLGFNQAAFFMGAPLTNNFALSDDAYRVLLFAKALANISDGSIPSINQLLLNLFPSRGNCYVTDGQNMTMTYTFLFALSSVEYAIINSSGVMPKPVGVSVTVVVP